MADVQLIRYFMNVAIVDDDESIEDKLIKELVAMKKAYERALGRERELESIIKQKNDDNQRAKIELQSELQAKLAELKQKNEKCDTCNGLRIHAAHSINQGKTIAELERQRDDALKLCEIRARECDDLRCDRNAKNGINAALQRERNDLRENCAALDNKIMTLEREQKTKDSQIAKLEGECQDLRKAVEVFGRSLAHNENVIHQERTRLGEANKRVAGCEKEYDNLRAEYNKLRADYNELKDVPPLVEMISAADLKEIKDHTALVIKSWDWKSTAVSVDINVHNQIVADRNAIIEGLRQQETTLRQEVERLKEEVKELQRHVGTHRTRYQELAKHATATEEEAKRLADANMLLQETLATNDTIIKMLTNPSTINYPSPNH